MKLSPFYLLVIFWINANDQHVCAEEWNPDHRFLQYKECMARRDTNTIEEKLFSRCSQCDYDTFNKQCNLIFEKTFPIAIFTPASVEDVQNAVKCGVETNIQIVPVSGGHSYAGLSTGTDDSIIIYFRNMKNVSIDRNEATALVESGVLLGNLYGILWNDSFIAPLGSCTTVAMGGLVLGGGSGYFSNYFGLVIDNIVEMNVVDASGNAVLVDETHNEDLWWALRGVGPGYIGILTSVKLKVFKADDIKLTYVKFKFETSSFTNVMAKFFKWLDWVKRNDPTLNSVITIRDDNYTDDDIKSGRPDENGIVLQILQIQDSKVTRNQDFISAAEEIFEQKIAHPKNESDFMDFLLSVTHTPVDNFHRNLTQHEQFGNFSMFNKEDGQEHYYYARSFFVEKSYDAQSFDEAQKTLLKMPKKLGGILITSEQGKISEVPADATAYVHRDALFNLKFFIDAKHNTSAELIEQGTMWVDKFYESAKFMDSKRIFPNYPERDITDYLVRYYGTNLERLKQIKKKWDPDHYFNSKQAI